MVEASARRLTIADLGLKLEGWKVGRSQPSNLETLKPWNLETLEPYRFLEIEV